MFIVSDELLERLICCQCKKYLSVYPVKVYPNRGIKCGRCSITGDAGVVSLFGVLAEQALFRCVNRFEGCNQLLFYFDTAEHEKSCTCKEYICPCCIETFKGNAYEIYNHFKEKHFDQVLINISEFVLEIDNELVKSYLYRKNDLLFYINATYNKGEEEVILNVMYLGTAQDASKMFQIFTLHSLDGKLKYKTRRKSCSSVTGGNLKCFKININPADFSKNIVLCRLDLNTENVDCLLALPEDLKKAKSFTCLGTENLLKLSDFNQKTVGFELTENEGIMPTTDVPSVPPRILFFKELIGSYPDKKSIPPEVPFPNKPAPKASPSFYDRRRPGTYFLHQASSTATTSAPITIIATGVNSFNQPITVTFQASTTTSTTTTSTFGTSNFPSSSFGKSTGIFSSASNQQLTTTVSSTAFRPTSCQPTAKPRFASRRLEPTTTLTTSSSLFGQPTGSFNFSNQQKITTVSSIFGKPHFNSTSSQAGITTASTTTSSLFRPFSFPPSSTASSSFVFASIRPITTTPSTTASCPRPPFN